MNEQPPIDCEQLKNQCFAAYYQYRRLDRYLKGLAVDLWGVEDCKRISLGRVNEKLSFILDESWNLRVKLWNTVLKVEELQNELAALKKEVSPKTRRGKG